MSSTGSRYLVFDADWKTPPGEPIAVFGTRKEAEAYRDGPADGHGYSIITVPLPGWAAPGAPGRVDPSMIAELTSPTPEQERAGLDLIGREYDIDPELRMLRCKRCGEVVTWATMHARERHGDDVVVFIHPRNAAQPQVW